MSEEVRHQYWRELTSLRGRGDCQVDDIDFRPEIEFQEGTADAFGCDDLLQISGRIYRVAKMQG
ncbi:MAG: hypothetical protein DI562_03400 [Stenotrophomonas acidaminiphila]|nr:MAG: hypothetical protein DI562_03400 [Stenotrophomonas acidaminiphila]